MGIADRADGDRKRGRLTIVAGCGSKIAEGLHRGGDEGGGEIAPLGLGNAVEVGERGGEGDGGGEICGIARGFGLAPGLPEVRMAGDEEGDGILAAMAAWVRASPCSKCRW